MFQTKYKKKVENEIYSKNLQDEKIRLIFRINLPHNVKEKIVQKI